MVAKKGKEYYTEIFNSAWNNCLREAEKDVKENGGTEDIITDVATDIFETTANAEEVVGYYIVYHKESALKDWSDNIKGIELSEQDKQVDRILKELYPKQM